jgi:hypothetical protein
MSGPHPPPGPLDGVPQSDSIKDRSRHWQRLERCAIIAALIGLPIGGFALHDHFVIGRIDSNIQHQREDAFISAVQAEFEKSTAEIINRQNDHRHTDRDWSSKSGAKIAKRVMLGYSHGPSGFPRNTEEAKRWYRAAADHGNQEAAAALQGL